MKNKLTTVCFAGLLGLTGLLLSGCSTTDDEVFTPALTTQLREYVLIPNSTSPGTITVKGVNVNNGASVLLNSGVNTGGNGANIIKTQNGNALVFVSNPASSNLSTFQMNVNGGLTLLNTVATPNGNTNMLIVSPVANFVYAAGGTQLQAYSIGNGGLTPVGAVVNLANTVQLEGAFSNGGNTLHIPELNGIESFTVTPATGLLSGPVLTALAGKTVRDVSLSPGGGILEAVTLNGAVNDEVRAYPVAAGVLGAAVVTALPAADFAGANRPETADFAANGQYFIGMNNAPLVRGYNVSATGALTEFANSPSASPSSSRFTALDPSNQFIFSMGGGVLDVRGRLNDGTMSGVTSDSLGVANGGRFDFLFNFFQN